MPTRTSAVAAAIGAAVIATTGITYASPAGSRQAAPSVQRAAPSVQRAAPSVQRAGPIEALLGDAGENRKKNEGRDHKGRDNGYDRKGEGRIYFNERTYSASTVGCIPAASGLGSNSFNIFNDSWKVVEVFRGFNCNNGSPVATVGPHGATDGVVTSSGHEGVFGDEDVVGGGVFGDDGVVGSFRVFDPHYEW